MCPCLKDNVIDEKARVAALDRFQRFVGRVRHKSASMALRAWRQPNWRQGRLDALVIGKPEASALGEWEARGVLWSSVSLETARSPAEWDHLLLGLRRLSAQGVGWLVLPQGPGEAVPPSLQYLACAVIGMNTVLGVGAVVESVPDLAPS